MRSDNWTEETIPSRRVGPGDGEVGDDARSDQATVPIYVWVLGFIVVLLVLMVCGLWALYLLRGQVAISGPTPTPIIWTPTSAPSPTASSTETAEPAPTVSPDVAIGRYVRVAGTGGHGLNLRSGPGENYTRMDVALEGEIFIVVDGPAPSGDSEWWKVRDPESGEEWWAIGNYLEPAENP